MVQELQHLPEYKDDPLAYEIEERSRPDEMAMLNAVGMLAVRELNRMQDASVLDLCCGTGLSLEHLVGHQHVRRIIGVDICEQYLEFARQKYAECRLAPIFINGDVVDCPLPHSSFDLIMMASAYHHIEDQRKVPFLKRVHRLLSQGGCAVMAENILPEYREGDRESYKSAVRIFYEEVLGTAMETNPSLPSHVKGLIQRVAKHGFDGDYEYKVKLDLLKRDLESAELEISYEERVWPEHGPLLSTGGGNYVIQLRAR